MGGALICAGAAARLAPSGVVAALRAFPRDRRAAWVLSAAALAWTAWMLRGANLGRFAFVRPWLWPAVPVAAVAVNRCMGELLAPRTLGGLLLLAAAPLLHAVRMHDSGWSRVPAALAYVLVLTGIALVLSPWRFRQAAARLTASPGRLRGVAGAVLAAGLALTVFGVGVLR